MTAVISMVTGTNTSAVPPDAIGSEPNHGFCYYFQKVNLAKQFGQKDIAGELAAEAVDQGLTPNIAVDWTPIVSALFRDNDIVRAKKAIIASAFG